MGGAMKDIFGKIFLAVRMGANSGRVEVFASASVKKFRGIVLAGDSHSSFL
jgi:hypothetical protein